MTEDTSAAAKLDPREPAVTTETEALSLDAIFGILSNSRRRAVLQYLRHNDGTATLGDAAEYIAAEEQGIPIDALSSGLRKRAYTGLRQVHLPKMDEVGVIDFDKDRGRFELRPASADLFRHLDCDAEGADARTRPALLRLSAGYALGTTVTVLLFDASTVVDVSPVWYAVVGAVTLASLWRAVDR